MKIRTENLTGAALDWAVARAEWPQTSINTAMGFPYLVFGRFNPSANWEQAGPIIDREHIDINHSQHLGYVSASIFVHPNESDVELTGQQEGPTALVAAMRAYVESKLGEEVDIPAGLA